MTDPASAVWRKSSRSGGNGACVEVAVLGADAVGVRDSKSRGAGHLEFSADSWRAFLAAVKAGDFPAS